MKAYNILTVSATLMVSPFSFSNVTTSFAIALSCGGGKLLDVDILLRNLAEPLDLVCVTCLNETDCCRRVLANGKIDFI
jgi:hypothetical protein